MEANALYVGAILLILIGIIHSVLGEKYILIRLFKRDNLPKLFGDDWFTKQTLRFAWHITTIAWWGFAVIVWIMANPGSDIRMQTLLAISVVFAVSGTISLVFSRGRHLSWMVFFAIVLACIYGTGIF